MTKKKKSIKCKRCGKCCYPGCKWLIRYIDGTTRCAIYPHRLGAIVDEKGNYCHKRGNTYIEGCPYNYVDNNGRTPKKIREDGL